MNEELKNKANEVLLQLLNKATEVGEAAMAEIPLVVQELLTWRFAESLIQNVIGLLIALFWLWVYKKIIDHHVKSRDDLIEHPEYMFLTLTIFGWIPVFEMVNTDWIKIWLAPRVYLLEYAASLIK